MKENSLTGNEGRSPRKDDLLKLAREASNNASRSMRKLTEEQVKVSISNIRIRETPTFHPDLDPETMVASVYLPLKGDISGSSLLIFPEEVARVLCGILRREHRDGIHRLSALDRSALKEVGNIIIGSFLTIISNALKIRTIEGVPSFKFDMFSAVIDGVIAEFGMRAEEALIIDVSFDFKHSLCGGHVIVLFGVEEMNVILDALEKRVSPA